MKCLKLDSRYYLTINVFRRYEMYFSLAIEIYAFRRNYRTYSAALNSMCAIWRIFVCSIKHKLKILLCKLCNGVIIYVCKTSYECQKHM